MRDWIHPRTWRIIQNKIPIACIDVLPIEVIKDTHIRRINKIGLILRKTPHQGLKWCLIGGRLGHNESVIEAINREIFDALGNDVIYTIREDIQPDFIAQYFSVPIKNSLFDPRQHAIGLTYCIQIKGKVHPQNEALKFKWYNLMHLPPSKEFGFNQDKVVEKCIAKYNNLK